MSRDWRIYLDDIVDSADLVRGWVDGLAYEDFLEDERTYYAVVCHLMIIGEAVKKVPDRVRALAPEIPWHQVAGFRDVLIHAYFAVEDPVVWSAVQDHLPDLRSAADRLRALPDPAA